MADFGLDLEKEFEHIIKLRRNVEEYIKLLQDKDLAEKLKDKRKFIILFDKGNIASILPIRNKEDGYKIVKAINAKYYAIVENIKETNIKTGER